MIRLLKNRNASNLHPSWRFRIGDESNNFNKAVEIIFESLPYTALCNCAVVSKTWRIMALAELKSRCTINVKNDDQVRLVLQKIKSSSNFKVGKCIITSPYVNVLLTKQMLVQVQSTLSVLRLEPSNIQEVFLFHVLANLPNLTTFSLILTCISSAEVRNRHEVENYWCCMDNFNSSCFPFLSGLRSTPFSCPSCGTSKCTSRQPCNHEKISSTENLCMGDRARDKGTETFVHHRIRHVHLDIGKSGRLQLSKILYTFPNVVELNVSNIVDESRKPLKCQQQESAQYKCDIRHLSIRQYSSISYSEKLVQTLMKFDMYLERLLLILHPPIHTSPSSSNKTLQVYNALLKQFIESQGSSLKALKLIQVEDDVCKYDCCHYWNKSTCSSSIATSTGSTAASIQANNQYHWDFNYSSPSFSILPLNLPHLEILHVQKPLITNLAQVVNHFPKLKELSINVSPHGSNWKGMFPQRLETHRHIINFKLDFIDNDSLSRLGNCFPSLQTLQLSYCDESLFNVLGKLIPYFNGKAAKENLASCHQCHGNSGKSKGEGSTSRTYFNRDRQCEADKKYSSSKGINQLNNLKLLRMRPCHHFAYENFVFLQGGSHVTSQSSTSSVDGYKLDNNSGNGEFDSSFGFSWNTSDVMRDKEFTELTVNCSENTESCSSA